MNVWLLGFLVLSGWVTPGFSLDRDGDGIPNQYDECKSEPEDKDNFQDNDGCPDVDNDKDGICDPWVAQTGQSAKWAKECKGSDKCPLVPEDIDGFQDDDGCPDPDNDGDGYPDKKDKCPNEKEDVDGFEDNDGCPDPDNDKDGILDADDKCPMDPEDIDGFEDEDGCPDYDNDGDGIKDVGDKCPNEAETFNEVDDTDGCPDMAVLPIPESQQYPNIKFRVGTDELIFESFRSLDSLAEKLTAYKKARVSIHLFAKFVKDEAYNLELLASQEKAIIEYMVSKGAAKEQFTTQNYSPEGYQQIKGTPDDYNQKKMTEIRLSKEEASAPSPKPDAEPATELEQPSETEEKPAGKN